MVNTSKKYPKFRSRLFRNHTCKSMVGTVTSVLQHFRPTVLPSYDTLELRSSYRSDIQSILLLRPTQELQILSVYIVDSATIRIDVPVAHKFKWVRYTLFVGQMHTFVGQMHTFCRSDAQLWLVGCTLFVGRMHNLNRSDEQL